MLQGLSGWNIISSLVGLIIIGAAIGVIVALVSRNGKRKAAKSSRAPLGFDYVAPLPANPPLAAPPASPAAAPAAPPSAAPPGLPTPDPAEALETLNDLRSKGLISEAEYTELRARIIDRI